MSDRVYISKRKCKGKTTYHLRWVCPVERRWKSRYAGTDRTRAEGPRELLERELAEGSYSAIRPTTWQAFSKEHAELTPHPQSREAIRQALAEFGTMFNNPLPKRVTFDMVESYAEKLRANGNAVSTVNKKLRFLRAAFNKAIRRCYLTRNPMEGWRWQTVDLKAIRTATDAEVAALLDAAEELHGVAWRAFIVVALGTGGRLSELLGLTWDRVDLDAGVVHFTRTKGRRDRKIPVNPDVVQVFRKLRLQVQAVQTGRPFAGMASIPTVQRHWLDIRSKAGIKGLTMHDLRRTYITRLIRANNPLPTVQRLAGHSNIETTLRYYNEVTMDDMRQAVAKLA